MPTTGKTGRWRGIYCWCDLVGCIRWVVPRVARCRGRERGPDLQVVRPLIDRIRTTAVELVDHDAVRRPVARAHVCAGLVGDHLAVDSNPDASVGGVATLPVDLELEPAACGYSAGAVDAPELVVGGHVRIRLH